jgi:hypothetical protein
MIYRELKAFGYSVNYLLPITKVAQQGGKRIIASSSVFQTKLVKKWL